MPDLIYHEDILYEDFDEPIAISLKMVGGWIYIETPIERKTVNSSELRYDGVPRNVLNYVINERPNKTLSSLDLKGLGLATSRDLRQIAIKAGIKGAIKDYFMPICDMHEIKIITPITIPPNEVELLIDSLS